MLLQSKISLCPVLTAAWEKQKESPFYFSSISAQLKHPKLPEVISTSIQRAELCQMRQQLDESDR